MRASDVTSAWGSNGTPKATPFPAFQPPPAQARSKSIAVPSSRRCRAESVRQQPKASLSAIRLKAVGTTQLAAPTAKGQP